MSPYDVEALGHTVCEYCRNHLLHSARDIVLSPYVKSTMACVLAKCKQELCIFNHWL